MTGAAAALLLAAAASASVPGAQSEAEVAVPTGTVVAAAPAPPGAPRVYEVRIERKSVFDPAVPGEDWWPFQIANKLHFVTREPVVRRELLFGPGDPWDPLKVIETERNLRANYPFRRAEIERVPRPDGTVDAVVRTQDAWSTNPRLGFGTSGGQSSASYGIEENNLFGYGKSAAYTHSQGQSTSGDMRSDTVSYGDPRFLGTRLGLNGSYGRTQDGDQGSARLARPFYSLDEARAMGVFWSENNGLGSQVQDGADYSRYFVRTRGLDAAYAWRLSDDRWFVQRLEAGWYDARASFSPTTAFPGTVAGALPASREFSGPTIGYSWTQPKYLKETYIDRMERVEDFNLGNELRVRTGYMARGAGSDEDRWIFNASDRQGLSLGPGRFLLAGVGASGRLFNNKWENGLLTANLNLFWKSSAYARDRTLVAHVEAAQGRRLDLQNQIVLGGSTGLRGYKNDSFVGGRSVLVNLEDRFFVPGEYLHLARFGGAVFVESGSVVPEGSGFSPARFRSDVGFGLRGTSTRSTSGGVVRLDLAYALNGGPGRSRWVVSLRAGQAFSFFNSASSRVQTSPASRL